MFCDINQYQGEERRESDAAIKKSHFIFLYLFFLVCKMQMKMWCPSPTKNVGALLQLNPSLTFTKTVSRQWCSFQCSLSRTKIKRKHKGPERAWIPATADRVSITWDWKSCTNVFIIKLFQLIIISFYWIKGLLCSHQMARRALGNHF